MSVVFAMETVNSCLDGGIESLIRAHWREVGLDHDAVPLSVDWNRYRRSEAEGSLFALTMRDDGKLVGYNIFFVMPHMNYMNTVFGLNNVVYVCPTHRGMNGLRLLLETDRRLKEKGVVKSVYHSKNDFLLAVLGRDDGVPDSLDRVEELMALELEYDLVLPDDVVFSAPTLGAVLLHLGYRADETVYTKLLV
jgi:hypothetical protein